MKKQNIKSEKKLKLAEAGIMFALVLGLTIFLGVHFSGTDEAEIAALGTIPASTTEIIDEQSVPVSETPVLVESDPVETVSVEATEAVEIINEEPEPRVVTYAMAEAAYFDRDFELASDLFNQYTDEHASNAWGFYMLGLSQWKAGEADVAEESFLAALELKPDHQKSLVNYGRVLIELDRSNDARQQIEIALTVNPENISARRVLGRLQHNSGQLDAAAETYQVVLRTQQDDVWALNNLGLIRIEQERFAEALAPLAKAVSINSAVACIQNNLGVALERTGHFTAAGEAFAQALSVDSDYEKAEISLARLENLVEADDTVPVDLAALAAGFTVEVVAEAAPEADDMEVAAAGDLIQESLEPSTTEIVEPDADGSRNR
jgi:tetratricopeptide (TPR) repeat protein